MCAIYIYGIEMTVIYKIKDSASAFTVLETSLETCQLSCIYLLS